VKKKKTLLRLDEVIKRLPYSETKIYELIREGKLMAACPNGVGKKPVFILEESVDRYIEEIIVDPDEWLDIEISQKKRKRGVISRGVG